MADLWAVHVYGSDDIIPTRDWWEANNLARQYCAVMAELAARPDADPNLDPIISAAVIRWPGDAQSHAEALRRAAEVDR